MSPQRGFRFSDARHYLPYVLLIVVFVGGVWIILTVGSSLDRGTQTRTTTAAGSPLTSLTESFNENFRNPMSILLMQIVVIIIMAGLFGRLFRRLGQPPVMAEMLAGNALGPSVLGLFFLSTLSRHVGPRGALTGVIVGIACMAFVWLQLKISWQWYVLIGSTITFVTGSLASLAIERKPQA